MERLVTTTYLEMTAASQALPYRKERRLGIRRAEIPLPELNRFFYLAVGSDWTWYTRRDWTAQRWREWAERPELETWIGYRKGTPAGYFELERQPGDAVELAYFGLLPRFIGQGLGAELLAGAVARAWQPGTGRVWVHTCSLDHPHALRNYRSRGFAIYAEEERVETLPDEPLTGW